MGKGGSRWESHPQVLKGQKAHKHTAPCIHLLYPMQSSKDSPSPCPHSLPWLPCGDFFSSLLFRAALVLILAYFLRNNMVMKLSCVMSLGAHPLLENLIESNSRHSRMETENANERVPPMDNPLSSPTLPYQALHPALGGQNKSYRSSALIHWLSYSPNSP